MDNGPIAIAPSTAQNINANPLPSHTTGPSDSSINVVSVKEFPIDPSRLIALACTIVCVYIMKSDTPLVAPVNYSLANPFIIGEPASVSP